MLDVLRHTKSCGNFQSQNVDVKAPASFYVVTLKRAMGKSLWHVAAPGKSLALQSSVPMACRVRAPMGRAARVVILDLKMVAAGLAKIDRVGEVSALRLGDFAQVIFFFVSFDILPCGFHFLMVRNAKTVVVVESFLRRVGAAFVNDQAPVGVGMLHCCLA